MRDFVVLLLTFLSAALVAVGLAWPVLVWATGGQEWQAFLATAWLVIACVGCQYVAFKALARYHRTTSEGRR